MSSVPFEYVQHLVTVPVVAGDRATRFVFDTGIGLTLLSESLAAEVGCVTNGSTYTGRRMSGQEVTVPLATLGSLMLAGRRRDDLTVGLFDMSVFPLEGIEGFLSLEHFQSMPVTVDYPAGVVVVEDAESIAARAAAGIVVDVRVERTAHTAVVFLALDLPGGRSVSVEVDMGSDALILDEALSGALGIALDDESVRKVEGNDETGQTYSRYFTTLPGVVNVTGAPSVDQSDPDVMFQKIIYDGLVGDAFLRNFVVTYDLENGRMIFA
jgi:hypothetical protein